MSFHRRGLARSSCKDEHAAMRSALGGAPPGSGACHSPTAPDPGGASCALPWRALPQSASGDVCGRSWLSYNEPSGRIRSGGGEHGAEGDQAASAAIAAGFGRQNARLPTQRCHGAVPGSTSGMRSGPGRGGPTPGPSRSSRRRRRTPPAWSAKSACSPARRSPDLWWYTPTTPPGWTLGRPVSLRPPCRRRSG